MNSIALYAQQPSGSRFDPDRIGVFASILCAIHCAVTPFLLLFAPAFGKVWSHPASHWLVAILVIPLAVVMMAKGYQRHRRAWIVASGMAGIVLIVIGAVIPYLEKGEHPETVTATPSYDTNDSGDVAVTEEDEFVYIVGEEIEIVEDNDSCLDGCCPTLLTDGSGETHLHVPLASIVTTLGGLALLMTHLGNICCCASCRKPKGASL